MTTDSLVTLDQDQTFGHPARAPISTAASYFRSKLIISEDSINPLVAAANPLFLMATRLAQLEKAPELSELNDDLNHEIKAFQQQAQALEYRSNVILAARYVLCSLIDETIQTSHWCSPQKWAPWNLLQTFQGESWGGERFFLILQRTREDPSLHLDLLELIYLAIQLGFEGKYRHMERGLVQLGTIGDELYQLIRQHRGDFSKTLAPHPPIVAISKPTHWFPIWGSVVLTCAIVIGGYFMVDHQLFKTSSHAYQNLLSVTLQHPSQETAS